MGHSPQHRHRARLQAGVGLLAAVVLSGCSGTRFGDQLARSFSAPEPTAPATAGGAAASPTPTAPPKPVAQAVPPTTTPTTTPVAAPAPIPAPAPPGAPAPYRVTLRLPAADSSAPAERVTQALRAAGVSFEVETIERIPGGGDGGGGGTNSAGLGAPRRIPAPQPR